jgi:hypothetical protein
VADHFLATTRFPAPNRQPAADAPAVAA